MIFGEYGEVPFSMQIIILCVASFQSVCVSLQARGTCPIAAVWLQRPAWLETPRGVQAGSSAVSGPDMSFNHSRAGNHDRAGAKQMV